jgi:hypothetical protein
MRPGPNKKAGSEIGSLTPGGHFGDPETTPSYESISLPQNFSKV